MIKKQGKPLKTIFHKEKCMSKSDERRGAGNELRAVGYNTPSS